MLKIAIPCFTCVKVGDARYDPNCTARKTLKKQKINWWKQLNNDVWWCFNYQADSKIYKKKGASLRVYVRLVQSERGLGRGLTPPHK